MNNRDYRILNKVIDEVILMNEMVDGYTIDDFLNNNLIRTWHHVYS